MKKNIFKTCKMIFLIVLIMLLLTGCENNANNDIEQLKEKNKAQLEYIDKIITDLLNNLNNITMQNYAVTSITQMNANNNDNGSSLGSNSENVGDTTEEPTNGSNKSSSADNFTSGSTSNVPGMEMSPVNILNNTSKSIDWRKVGVEVEKIYETWSSTILDCYKLDANSADILDFSNKLDILAIHVKNNDKTNTIITLAQMYSNIPKFMDAYMLESAEVSIKYTKSNVIDAYSNAEQSKWDEASQNLVVAEEYFKRVVNDIDYNMDKKYGVDKAYILIKELQNSITLKDKEVFLIKYKLLILQLNEL